MLSELPQLAALYEENGARAKALGAFAAACEARLNACLRRGALPDARLVEAVASAKVTLKNQPWAYVTLECYGCHGCSTYPTKPIEFTEIKLRLGVWPAADFAEAAVPAE